MPENKKHNHVIYLVATFVALMIAGNIFSIISILQLQNRVDNLTDNFAKLVFLSSSDIEENLLELQQEAEELKSAEAIAQIGFSDVETDSLYASIPEGWEITETHGTPSEIFTGNFDGLSTIEINDTESDFAIKIMAVAEKLFESNTCKTYFKFPDFSQTHLDGAISAAAKEDLDLEVVNVKDFTNYEIFGTQIRRMGGFFLYDTNTSTKEFEPSCPEDSEFLRIPLKTLNYTYNGATQSEYTIEITGAYNNAEMELVDLILDSLEVK